MENICIICCYFGELPQYIEFWVKSCSYNSHISFILVTNQELNRIPKNLKIINMSIYEFNNLASNKLNLDIKINNAYKLCDFKPAYGKIFEDYIKEYDFWGYCDIDVVFGDIRKFITDEVLKENTIILNLGHLTILKNSEYNKYLYTKKGSIYSYKEVFTNKANFAFDEMSGMHLIMKNEKIQPYLDIPIADIDKRYRRYRLYNIKNYENQLFYFDNGIFRSFLDEKNIIQNEEYCYLHFQKKRPKILIKNIDKCNRFYINSEGFSEKEHKINLNSFKKHNIYMDNENKELLNYYIIKLIEFLKCEFIQKRIWIKQKIAKILEDIY